MRRGPASRRGWAAARRSSPTSIHPKRCRFGPQTAFFQGNEGRPSARPIQALRFRTMISSTLDGGGRGAVRVVDTCRLPSGRRLAGPDGGVPVSTGWQEARIACRGWSAGHVKSRPSFNCRSSVFSGCLTKQPRAMAPVGRASQSVAKSDSPRFTAWYGRG